MKEKSLLHRTYTRLPDMIISALFAVAAILSSFIPEIAEVVLDGLIIWFAYELVGVFFLLFWVALNEHRGMTHQPDWYRLITASIAQSGCALLMYTVFHFPGKNLLLSERILFENQICLSVSP